MFDGLHKVHCFQKEPDQEVWATRNSLHSHEKRLLYSSLKLRQATYTECFFETVCTIIIVFAYYIFELVEEVDKAMHLFTMKVLIVKMLSHNNILLTQVILSPFLTNMNMWYEWKAKPFVTTWIKESSKLWILQGNLDIYVVFCYVLNSDHAKCGKNITSVLRPHAG